MAGFGVAGLLFGLDCVFGIGCAAEAQEPYLRYPVVHEDVVVFGAEGDLWRASGQDGPAARLTSHPEVESNPTLSPDGAWVAFDANYDSATEVYVAPVAGGAPVRLTYEGGGASARGWLNDEEVLFVTSNTPGPVARALRAVHRETGAVRELPLADVTDAAVSGDGRTLVVQRFGAALRNDNVLLYRGGAMGQLWRHTLGSDEEAVRLAPDFDAPMRDPMWWGERIVFVSDKSGSDNLWSIDRDGADARQHTEFSGWQIRSPSINGGVVAFQRGADLYRYDLASDTESAIEVSLVTDRDHARDRWLNEPLNNLDDAIMSASGDAVAITARGAVVRAFPRDRRRIEYAIPEGARARSATLVGDWLYVIIDTDEIGEIWRFPADGRADPEQLTRDSDAHIWSLHPSPEGEAIAYHDKRGRLWLLDPETRDTTLVEETESPDDQGFGGFAWSPGGRYLAYAAPDARWNARVTLYDTEDARREVVTTAKFASYAPAFSADGEWLYFVSARNFDPTPGSPWGDRNMGVSFSDRGLVYALALTPDARFPFRAADELTLAEDAASDEEEDASGEGSGDASGDDEDAGDVEIVFDGLVARLWPVPVDAGNYGALAANEKNLFLVQGGAGGASVLRLAFTADDPEAKPFTGGVQDFALSADGETAYVRKGFGGGAQMLLVPANAEFPGDLSANTVRVGDWRLKVDPAAEWRQLFLDAWRLHREFAYDQDLRGVDWDGVREKYEPLAARVGHRSELNDLLAQMIAELGILHSQIGAGDLPQDDETGASAFLGAQLRPARGGVEIATILLGEPDRPRTHGPLSRPDLDIRDGDVITAINGTPVRSRADVAEALATKTGQQVRLDLRRGRDDFSAIVEPISRGRQAGLLYGHWVEANRRRVAEASDGRYGYLHLRAMGSGDLASFARDFYEHFDKDGLIIDVRGNSGGNIDSLLIQTLLRQAWAFWEFGGGDKPTYTNMQQAFRGHLVVLINERTYSDGETFAAGVKALDLGTTIGTRTAGAGIWLSDRNRLTDGGIARIAEFAQFGLDGRWLIEGRGVSPDVEVVNAPVASHGGADAQLDRALATLDEKVARDPIPVLSGRPLPPLGVTGEDVD